MTSDERFMRYACALALRGEKQVRPNPPVGAVIVKDGKIIGRGWHRQFGGAHAEIEALNDAATDVRGATLYVTLEPCNHTGKTGPCAEAVLKAGFSRVVIGIRDPNPKVAGGGVERLRAAGVEVLVGCLTKEVSELKSSWISWITSGQPLLSGVLARTLDGQFFPLSALDQERVPSAFLSRLRQRFDRRLFSPGPEVVEVAALKSLGGSGVQNVLSEEPTQIFHALSQGTLSRLLLVHLPAFSPLLISKGLTPVSVPSSLPELRLLVARRIARAGISWYSRETK